MANETKLSHIINPEVLPNMIEGKLVNAMKFTPLCKVGQHPCRATRQHRDAPAVCVHWRCG